MPSLLEQFWGFYLNEHSKELDPEALKAMDVLMDAELALISTLNEEQKELYKKYSSTVTDYQAVLELIAFRHGVRLGVQFMTEARGNG